MAKVRNRNPCRKFRFLDSEIRTTLGPVLPKLEENMGILNLDRTDMDAIKSIDEHELTRLIDRALAEKHLGDLRSLPLHRCGIFVSTKLRYYEEALSAYSAAKSSRNREDKEYWARRAGSDLSFAFSQMQHLVETQERESLTFIVDDHTYTPYTQSSNMRVPASYQWRSGTGDEWNFGSIAFTYTHNPRREYTPPPKRKPSVAQLRREEQEELRRVYEHFESICLFTVRDYFRDGGDGNLIPKTFEAKADHHSKGINNHSAKFWAKPDGS